MLQLLEALVQRREQREGVDLVRGRVGVRVGVGVWVGVESRLVLVLGFRISVGFRVRVGVRVTISVLPSKREASSLSASSSSALVRAWAMPVSISSVKPVVRSSCWLSTW